MALYGLYRRPRSRPYSVNPTTYPVKISHLPLSCSERDVREVFARFGPIHTFRLHRGGEGGDGETYAHVNYTDRSSATAAVQAMDTGRHIFRDQSRALRVVMKDSGAVTQQQQLTCTLKLLHLPAVTTEAEVDSVCKQFGAVSVKLNKSITGNYAYANFPDHRSAEAAQQYLNNDCRFNGQQIKATWHFSNGSAQPRPSAAPINCSAAYQPKTSSLFTRYCYIVLLSKIPSLLKEQWLSEEQVDQCIVSIDLHNICLNST